MEGVKWAITFKHKQKLVMLKLRYGGWCPYVQHML